MKSILLSMSCALLILISTAKAQNAISLKTNSTTVLYANQGSEGWGQKNITNWGDIVVLWYGTSQWLWYVNAPAAGDYYVDLLYSVPAQSAGTDMEIASENNPALPFKLEETKGFIHDNGLIDGNKNYERRRLSQPMKISAGVHWLGLSSKNVASGRYLLNLRGVELTPVAASAGIDSVNTATVSSRADISWMQNAVYGGMFHWTNMNVNQQGNLVDFDTMVTNFNVDTFVKQAEDMGLGYVLFTIGHAFDYCPAPLQSWAKYHGNDHITQRDLIMELADALAAKNIKLMLYFPTHTITKYCIHQTYDKSTWDYNLTYETFYTSLTEIITEVGTRYGKKVSGYWFDGWYQCFEKFGEMDFKSFYATCKIGNPDRTISTNPWVLPTVTEWEDYYGGEVFAIGDVPTSNIINYGPSKNKSLHFLITMEDDWVMVNTSKKIVIDKDNLVPYVKACQTSKIPVTVNLLVYADGTVMTGSRDNMVYLKNNIVKSLPVSVDAGKNKRFGGFESKSNKSDLPRLELNGQNRIVITNAGNRKDVSFSLTDLQGRKILSETFSGTNGMMARPVCNGVYFYKIKFDNKVISDKLSVF